MSKPTILFAGSPDFALPALDRLVAGGYPVVGVLTQPDKPFGRKQELKAPPVKERALEHGLTVFQPARFSKTEPLPELAELQPDFLITAAYGLILPDWLLELPAVKPLNVHASLLPKYRGAAPIQAAILAGDKEAGVSIMEMTQGVDEGPVYLQKAIPIAPDEDGGSLFDKLATLGGDALIEALENFDSLEPVPQDPARATHVQKLSRDDGALDFTQPAAVLERKIRALRPWPSAFTHLDGDRYKIWAAELAAGEGGPGEIIDTTDGLTVACGEGALSITELQKAGSRRMAARDMAHNVPAGAVFKTEL